MRFYAEYLFTVFRIANVNFLTPHACKLCLLVLYHPLVVIVDITAVRRPEISRALYFVTQ